MDGVLVRVCNRKEMCGDWISLLQLVTSEPGARQFFRAQRMQSLPYSFQFYGIALLVCTQLRSSMFLPRLCPWDSVRDFSLVLPHHGCSYCSSCAHQLPLGWLSECHFWPCTKAHHCSEVFAPSKDVTPRDHVYFRDSPAKGWATWPTKRLHRSNHLDLLLPNQGTL
jgi:hypothetical protein